MKSPAHPLDETRACYWHLLLAALYVPILWFHVIAAHNHWRDR